MSLQPLTVADILANPDSAGLALVKHEIFGNTKDEVILEQVRHNLARGLPEITANSPKRRIGQRAISLCGSAPSLMQNLHHLTGKVLAFNAAIPALHKAGVRVDYAMIWDATPEMVRYCLDVPGCEWLIASRVNPAVIDKLLDLGQKVTLWHAADAEPAIQALLRGRLMILGGVQSVTRGSFVAGVLGFRDLHIFGADSSYGNETHIGGSLRDEKEVVCMFENVGFRTTMWMMHQAESWVTFVLPELVPTGMRFTVYGDGLLPAGHRSWLRQCLPWYKRLAWRWSPWW